MQVVTTPEPLFSQLNLVVFAAWLASNFEATVHVPSFQADQGDDAIPTTCLDDSCTMQPADVFDGWAGLKQHYCLELAPPQPRENAASLCELADDAPDLWSDEGLASLGQAASTAGASQSLSLIHI